MKIRYTYLIAVALVILTVALAYDALNSYMSPYLTASQLERNHLNHLNKNVQVIGTIVNGSAHWGKDGALFFDLTDGETTIKITYRGSLPQNFKEGQEAVVIGKLVSPNAMEVSELLLKCPSKYEGGQASLLSEPVFIIALLLGVAAVVYSVFSVALKGRTG